LIPLWTREMMIEDDYETIATLCVAGFRSRETTPMHGPEDIHEHSVAGVVD